MKKEPDQYPAYFTSTSHEYGIEHIQVLQSVVILFSEEEDQEEEALSNALI